ncbi:hypothetical protein FACS1894200_06330 [Spirochaetia bacterium]|nr:hypothetical protein FACS1894200_06330 [Spirochaetia bacterium]
MAINAYLDSSVLINVFNNDQAIAERTKWVVTNNKRSLYERSNCHIVSRGTGRFVKNAEYRVCTRDKGTFTGKAL